MFLGFIKKYAGVVLRLINEHGFRVKLSINIFVLAVSLYGVSRWKIISDRTTPFERLMIDTFAPVQRTAYYIRERLHDLTTAYFLNVDATRKNVILQKQIDEQEKRIFEFREMELENQRLKALLQFGTTEESTQIMAQVVAWDASSDMRVLRINKGLKDGIKDQSIVVTAKGLVGYIYRISDHFADVLTILDSNNHVDVLVERTRSYGIVEGHRSNTCVMKYLIRTDPVILNDVVLTSGLGNIYPKGVSVGKITRIEKESYGISQYVEITPSVDFEKLEEVIVVVLHNQEVRDREWALLDKDENE